MKNIWAGNDCGFTSDISDIDGFHSKNICELVYSGACYWESSETLALVEGKPIYANVIISNIDTKKLLVPSSIHYSTGHGKVEFKDVYFEQGLYVLIECKKILLDWDQPTRWIKCTPSAHVGHLEFSKEGVILVHRSDCKERR